VGECRFGEVAGEQGGDRDAELGTGELERQLAQGVADGTRGAVAPLGLLLDLGPVDGDECELRGDEPRVGGGEEDERQQREQRGQ
jgi:hypothetical protein